MLVDGNKHECAFCFFGKFGQNLRHIWRKPSLCDHVGWKRWGGKRGVHVQVDSVMSPVNQRTRVEEFPRLHIRKTRSNCVCVCLLHKNQKKWHFARMWSHSGLRSSLRVGTRFWGTVHRSSCSCWERVGINGWATDSPHEGRRTRRCVCMGGSTSVSAAFSSSKNKELFSRLSEGSYSAAAHSLAERGGNDASQVCVCETNLWELTCGRTCLFFSYLTSLNICTNR